MLRFRLKDLRDDKGISQAVLGKALGLGQSTVGMWESGKNYPDYTTLLKIADYFGVSIDYLAGKSSVKKIATELSVGITLTPHESKVITAYRDNPPVQPVVDKILDVEPEQETASPKEDTVIRLAARDGKTTEQPKTGKDAKDQPDFEE